LLGFEIEQFQLFSLLWLWFGFIFPISREKNQEVWPIFGLNPGFDSS